MKATEFRLNNSVSAKSPEMEEWVGVHPISIYDLAYLNDKRSGMPVDIKPIPLTEEWLVKFGFYKLPVVFQLNGYYLVKQDNSNNWWVAHSGSNAKIAIIKHVHQLQNLYFALTGEELTLNKEL